MNHNIQKEIQKLIKNSIKGLQKKGILSAFKIPEIFIEHPKDKIYGDYSANIALEIVNNLRIKISSKTIAELIVNKLRSSKKSKDLFENVKVAGPGFINFFLSKNVLFYSITEIIRKKEKYGSSSAGRGKVILIDYSAPNIAKPFGIGHLRSTIIGQAIYNIYKFLGWKCVGDNHLGDWGTQFGKLIVAIKKWNKKDPAKLSVDELEKLYVRFHRETEKDDTLLDEAREWFKKLEKGDKEAEKIWKICVDVSLKEFNRVYNILGIRIDNALGESFYRNKVQNLIVEIQKKGFVQESQNALIMSLPNFKTPLMLLKADGTSTYASRDLLAVKHRLKLWRPDVFIYETGMEQSFYFKQLFSAVRILGWGQGKQFIHMGHGMIRKKQGKFSTRQGETIHLEKILNEAIKRARKIIDNSQTSKDLTGREKQKVAEIVGVGAIKYNDLSQHYSKDIIFNWEKILNLQGNSGPYLQYTAVRCQSVLKKARLRYNYKKKNEFRDFNQEEENILRIIYRFPEIVKEAAEKFSPNLIANFAFELAQNYNLFYNQHRVLLAKPQKIKEFRLLLTAATKQVLRNCLLLLGIFVPKKM